jgi:hypothetical protein
MILFATSSKTQTWCSRIEEAGYIVCGVHIVSLVHNTIPRRNHFRDHRTEQSYMDRTDIEVLGIWSRFGATQVDELSTQTLGSLQTTLHTEETCSHFVI